MRILVTGGSGYIGSHVSRLLKENGHDVVILDREADVRSWATEGMVMYKGDIADAQGVINVFRKHNFEAVIHLAASSLVSESVSNPLLYYANNVGNAGLLLEICKLHGVNKIVFSSTSAVYGPVDPIELPYFENNIKNPNTSYGSSKLCIEHMLRDVDRAHGIRSVALRYFNASGASPDGAIGELREVPSHLIPSIAEVALGFRKLFTINGDDYNTYDGTAIRDYTHVWDIAQAHIDALNYLTAGGMTDVINIGSGVGTGVRTIFEEFQKQWGKAIPCEIGERRPGDVEANYADITKAKKVLGWEPNRSTPQLIIEDAIRWYKSDTFRKLTNEQ